LVSVISYLGDLLRPEALEAGISLDPLTGAPTGVNAKITLREPNNSEKAAGFVSVDQLLALADRALEASGYQIWILFDRLDVAFEGSAELETNALRSLFRDYSGLLGNDGIQVKIFMRSDIWKALTSEGFREARHITRSVGHNHLDRCVFA
jgi:hypothetical protein